MSPLCSSTGPLANTPQRSFGPCRSTRMPIGRPVSSSSERIIATRSRMASCEAWLMLMRKTSAPAAKSAAIVSRSAEAGPSVAIIFTRLRRWDGCKALLLQHSLCEEEATKQSRGRRATFVSGLLRCARNDEASISSALIRRIGLIGQLNRPALRVLSGVDLEETCPVVASAEAVLLALDLELAVRSAHEGFAFPLAAALAPGVDIIIL